MTWALFEEPIVQLLVLAALTAAVRVCLLKRAEPSTAAGAAVMAASIFAIASLPQIPWLSSLIARPFAVEMIVVWVFIASAFVASYLHGTFSRHTSDPVGGFAIGTWVAGTAVLGRLIMHVIPEWRALAEALGLVALGLWFAYLVLIARRYGALTAPSYKHHVTGRILLSTVSTQSVVILGQILFPGHIPALLSEAAILLGYGFYAFGLVLIVRRYLSSESRHLADSWDNTNCIIHGAMSITGLAVVQTQTFPAWVAVGTWAWAFVLLLIVEAIEIVRLGLRVREYGWRKGVFTYQVSQWARNFTLGMFYAFTLNLTTSHAYYASQPGWLSALQGNLVGWGQYVVLLLLVLELGLYLAQNVSLARFTIPARRAYNEAGRRNA